jgi:PrtD family type I secretion system ABC transporter
MLDDKIRKHCRQAFGGLFVFGAILNLLMLTVPMFMLQVYDRVLASGSMSTLVALSAIAVFCLVLMAALDVCRTEFVSRTALGVETTIGPKAVQSALILGLENKTIDGNASVRDLEKVRSVFVSGALNNLIDLPWFPLYLLVVYLFHPVLGWVAVGGAVILLGLALANEMVSRSAMGQANQKQEEVAALSNGLFRSSEVVWAMGQAPALLDRWARLQTSSAQVLVQALTRGGGIQSVSKSCRQGLQIAMLAFGAGLAIDGTISPGVMVVASIIMGRALAPIEQTIGNWRTLQSGWTSWKRLRQIVAAAPPMNNSAAFDVVDTTIEVRNCSYMPPGARLPLVRSVNVDIANGEVVALIGPSGSGKTTLSRLLIGILVPTTGMVTIGGHSVSKLAPDQLAKLVGYVPQDFEFVPGTIAANISGFRTETVDNAVAEVAKRVGMHDLIQGLSNGYRTHIAAGSNLFSRGQAQRLALARALYNDPAMVVMDEPSSSLDQVGEECVLDVIEALKTAGRTVIIVAHRPSILTHADRVIVMKAGAVETVGKYSEILPYIVGRSARKEAVPPAKTASLAEKVRI